MNYSDKSDDELYVLWSNCNKYLNDHTKALQHGKAQTHIENIEKEWDRRLNSPDYTGESPKEGLMSKLGYRVGKTQGVIENRRREIIDFVVTQRLPFFFSPSYMAEWGEPNSDKRYTKLKNFLKSMLAGNHSSNMDQAKDERQKDLAYLESTYGDN